jgi:hypothetical protein
MIGGCQRQEPPVLQVLPASSTPDSTSIVLLYRSPTPSPTAAPSATLIPTPDPGANDLPEYYGGLVITLDDVGTTLAMRPQGGFLLRLGEEFTWDVTAIPPDVITLNRKVSLEPGEQGVFIARQKGRAVLRAVGQPVCLVYDPPCRLPTVLFEMNVLVE